MRFIPQALSSNIERLSWKREFSTRPIKQIHKEKVRNQKEISACHTPVLGRVTRKNEGMVVYHHMRGLVKTRERRTGLLEVRTAADAIGTIEGKPHETVGEIAGWSRPTILRWDWVGGSQPSSKEVDERTSPSSIEFNGKWGRDQMRSRVEYCGQAWGIWWYWRREGQVLFVIAAKPTRGMAE